MPEEKARAETTRDGEVHMTLGEHLEELRRRVLLSVIMYIVAFLACWVFKDPLMRLVARPHSLAMRRLGMPDTLLAIHYQEGFYAFMRLSAAAGLLVSSPYIIYQIWCFVAAGLYTRERRWVYRLGPASLGLFLGGMAFGFFVMIPIGLRFLAGVGSGMFTTRITVGSYLPLVLLLTALMGLVFELPLIMLFVNRIGLVEAGWFRRYRRHAIVAAFVIGAVLTPPDPFTQILMAVPICLLYELGLVVIEPRRGHIALVCAVVLLMLLSPVGANMYVNHIDAHAARVTAGAGAARRETAATVEQRQAVTVPIGLGAVIGADDELTAAGTGPLRLDLGSSVQVALQPGSRLRLLGRRAVHLIEGQLYVAVVGDTALRVVADEMPFTVQQGAANFQVQVTAEAGEPPEWAGGTIATAVSGALAYTHGGVEGTIASGRQGWFPRHERRVDVNQVTQWLQPPAATPRR